MLAGAVWVPLMPDYKVECRRAFGLVCRARHRSHQPFRFITGYVYGKPNNRLLSTVGGKTGFLTKKHFRRLIDCLMFIKIGFL